MDAYAVINGAEFVQTTPLTVNVKYSVVAIDGSLAVPSAFDLELPSNPALWKQAIMDGVVADAAGGPGSLNVIRIMLMDLQTHKV